MILLLNFLLFLIYSTMIFFLPNTIYLLVLLFFNLSIIFNLNLKKIIFKNIQLLPFIIFTFIINFILDNFINAFWISFKLIIVCSITIIYSEKINYIGITKAISLLFSPLKIFNINIENLTLLISISLSIFPILKKEIIEIQQVCLVKGIKFSIRNMKIILSKFLLLNLIRVNQIEEALISKGFTQE